MKHCTMRTLCDIMEKNEKVVDEMNSYEKLKRVCEEVDPLLAKCVTAESPEFKAWQVKAENILTKCYGRESRELYRFRNIIFYPRYAYATQSDEVNLCAEGLKEAKAYFEVYLEEIEDDCAENVSSDVSGISDEAKFVEEKVNSTRKKKVFIVHGHNDALKQEVARIIEKQGLEAIILVNKLTEVKLLSRNLKSIQMLVLLFACLLVMTMARQKMQPVKIYERDRMLCLKRAFLWESLGEKMLF